MAGRAQNSAKQNARIGATRVFQFSNALGSMLGCMQVRRSMSISSSDERSSNAWARNFAKTN
jgi:hypothetical protein